MAQEVESPMHDEPTDIPYGYCQCGCGQKTRVSHKNVTEKGWIKGEPLRFRKGHYQARRGVRQPERYRVEDCGHGTPCWTWLGVLDGHGYGRLGTRRHGTILAYHVYYVERNGPVPNGLELDHLCRNRACVNPDHLEAVTRAENQRRGLNGKLTRDEIQTIYRRAHAGEIQVSLALEYGVRQGTISAIKLGVRDSDITGHQKGMVCELCAKPQAIRRS